MRTNKLKIELCLFPDNPKLLKNFDLKILFVFKISLLLSYQYNMWTQTVLAVCLFFILYYLTGLNLSTEHTNNCNMKFLKSFFE
jgi:hypothetical protein